MKNYFIKHQKDLLWLANTEAGRYLLGIKNKKRIVKLSPNSFHQLRDFRNDRSIIEARFYTGNTVASILLPILTKMQIADQEYKKILDKREAFSHFSGLEEKRWKYPQIYLTVSTFIGHVTGSGNITKGDQSTWTEARDAASGTATPGATSAYIQGTISGGLFYVQRVFLPMDTSSLPAGFVVSTATLLTKQSAASRGAGSTAAVVQSTQASNTTLANSDFSLIGTTKGSDTQLLNGVDGTQITFTLNSTGIGWINNVFTKLGIRDNTYDILNVQPAALDDAQIYVVTAGKEPTLNVTYTAPSKGLPFLVY